MSVFTYFSNSKPKSSEFLISSTELPAPTFAVPYLASYLTCFPIACNSSTFQLLTIFAKKFHHRYSTRF